MRDAQTCWEVARRCRYERGYQGSITLITSPTGDAGGTCGILSKTLSLGCSSLRDVWWLFKLVDQSSTSGLLFDRPGNVQMPSQTRPGKIYFHAGHSRETFHVIDHWPEVLRLHAVSSATHRRPHCMFQEGMPPQCTSYVECVQTGDLIRPKSFPRR